MFREIRTPEDLTALMSEFGFLTLDACTAHSGLVNCIVIEDD